MNIYSIFLICFKKYTYWVSELECSSHILMRMEQRKGLFSNTYIGLESAESVMALIPGANSSHTSVDKDSCACRDTTDQLGFLFLVTFPPNYFPFYSSLQLYFKGLGNNRELSVVSFVDKEMNPQDLLLSTVPETMNTCLFSMSPYK